mgnify:CR=1 FL=1
MAGVLFIVRRRKAVYDNPINKRTARRFQQWVQVLLNPFPADTAVDVYDEGLVVPHRIEDVKKSGLMGI